MTNFTIQPVRFADYSRMKWKNGKGETLQIALIPKNAKFPEDPFLWRLSSAVIKESGPFSEFVGYNRAIVLLSGTGLSIQLNANRPQEVTHNSVFHFSGNEKAMGLLKSGPVVDLNLIWNDNKVRCNFLPITARAITTKNTIEFPVRAETQTVVLYFVKPGFLTNQRGERIKLSERDSCIFERDSESDEQQYIEINFENLGKRDSDSVLLYAIELSQRV